MKIKSVRYSVAKKRATSAFQLYVRVRDSDAQGYGRCCTCKKRVHYKEADGGHFISRSVESVVFDERNCHLQCKGCNNWRRGAHHVYRNFLVDTYGEEAVKKLEFGARLVCKRSVSDLLYLEKFYKQQTRIFLLARSI